MGTDISKSGNLIWRLPQSWMPGFALGVAATGLAIYAIIEAPAMWRTAERLKAEQIQQEDRAHCEKFRMLPASEDFVACVADLKEIRRLHRDRSLAEAAGMP
jgi:hypothetical protein